ncbi:MAG: hypothetical protein AAFN38_26085, partial [Cyanobacteria bacterium J06560_5]
GEGVITEVSSDGKTATIWFGGMPPRVLAYFSTPTVVVSGGRRLKVRSRDGLTVKAKLAEDAGNDGAPLQVGQLVFEAVRAVPKNLDLIVALDSRLERIERVDATSALSGLAFVSSTSDTDLPADCLPIAADLCDNAFATGFTHQRYIVKRRCFIVRRR